MKTKLLVKTVGMVLAFTCVLSILCGCTHSDKTTTNISEIPNDDMYILNKYIDIEHGESYYGEVRDDSDDEYIAYYIYDENGTMKYIGRVVRSHAIGRIQYAK